MTARAYSYKRFSSGNQKTTSIERQEKVLADAAKWCAEMGIPLDNSLSYVDIAVSAFRGKNKDTGALSQFLKAIETGKVKSGDYLIVEELSRLTRMEINDAQELFLSIINRGVKIVSLIDRKIFSRDIEPAQMMMDMIISISMLSASHLESFRKSKRGKEFYAGLRKDIAKGVVKTHTQCPWWIGKERDASGNTTFSIIEERANVIRTIFNQAAEGKGPQLIAQSLSPEMVRTLPNKDLIRYCQYILKSRAVMGYYQPKERVHVSGKTTKQKAGDETKLYPAIVSDSIFYRVQDLRAIRHRNNDFKFERVANIFGNLLKCCVCGHTLKLTKSKSFPSTGKYAHVKSLHHYLTCPASFAGQCNFLTASYTVIEPIILEHIRGLDVSYLLTGKYHTATQIVLDAIAENTAKARQAQEKIDNLLNALEASPDLDSVILARIKTIKHEMEQYNTTIAEHNAALSMLHRNTDTTVHALIDALKASPSDDDLRGKVKSELQRLVAKILVRETKLKDQQQYSSNIPVELLIEYRNGNTQLIVEHKGAKIVYEHDAIGNKNLIQVTPDGAAPMLVERYNLSAGELEQCRQSQGKP